MWWFILIFIILLMLIPKKDAAKGGRRKSMSGSDDYGLSEMKRQLAKEDKMIAALQKAKGLEGERKIAAYEKLLPAMPKNISFSYHYELVEMYIKTQHYNKAWAYTNKLYAAAMKNQDGARNLPKIRHLQFSVLKSEEKYKQAIEMLLSEYALSADYFDNPAESFIKSAKTCAKKAGIPDDTLAQLAGLIVPASKKRNPEDYIIGKYRSAVK